MQFSLRDYSDEDLWLTRALETDPDTMRHLGGPTPDDRIADIHARRLGSTRENGDWYFAIVPADSPRAAGTVGIWRTEWEGNSINEMGWMILPSYRGHGLATDAARTLIRRARVEGRWNVVHAFPYASNIPSNAICRNLGFSMIGEVEIAYNGPPRKANHWVIELSPAESPGRAHT